MAAPEVPVAIALGSNLGDRARHIAFAVGQLAGTLSGLRESATIETAPEGVPDDQPPFLNAVVTGATALGPRPLLSVLLDIERRCGRQRPHPGAARTLDLDLILYGREVVKEPGLIVPHPRFRERRFVLVPLAEIAGSWVDPVTGLSISALLRKLGPS